MASSRLSSVTGNPFSDGSGFGFLSLVGNAVGNAADVAAGGAGILAMAGRSTPIDKTQVTDKIAASSAFGSRETTVTRLPFKSSRIIELSNYRLQLDRPLDA